LAFSRNKTRDISNEYSGPVHPEKVVIVAGPSFGAALEFMLLGVAIGVAGALFWQKQKGTSLSDGENIVVGSGRTEAGAAMSHVLDRAGEVAKRARVAAVRARETVRSVGEAVGPTLSEALAEGKTAARQTEQELAEEISKEPPPTPGTTSIAADQA
jgi:hypothetical protein